MSSLCSIEQIQSYVLETYSGMVADTNWGERGLFYNPEKRLPKGIYLMTFKEKDGANDSASNIDRGGLYRLNLGISKSSFLNLFGETPKRPAAGHIVDTEHDFEVLDAITPHPVYGWMSWIAVLNPSESTFETLKPLIDESYGAALKKWVKKTKQPLP